MESGIHLQVLVSGFIVALIMGAVVQKTNFCTMGAVSDWVNMDDTGRLRAWLLAIAVAMLGVQTSIAMGWVDISQGTFPPYRTGSFAWLRYLVGGALFGVGMTLASGCGNKTLVRLGSGNLKSLVVLGITASFAYLMLWTDFYGNYFHPWIVATTIDLPARGIASQGLDDFLGGGGAQLWVGLALGAALLFFVFKSAEFRENRDNWLGGLTVGLAVWAGWWMTGSAQGGEWKDWAQMALEPPSRVETQSYTFISPMGDAVRYFLSGGQSVLINFGMAALAGVVSGSLIYSLATKSFRLEWFQSRDDFIRHAVGASLMGIGGVLAMGCTIGQAVTGVSTLALGSILTFAAIVAGAAATMKVQYWLMMRGE